MSEETVEQTSSPEQPSPDDTTPEQTSAPEQTSTPEQTSGDQTGGDQTGGDQTGGEQTGTAQDGAHDVAAPRPVGASPAGRRQERGHRKTRRGYVVSDKMDKTVVVEVEDRVKHPLYGKVMRRSEKVKAHDETNDCGVGDLVVISETRPLSATKRWRVLEILERAK